MGQLIGIRVISLYPFTPLPLYPFTPLLLYPFTPLPLYPFNRFFSTICW